MYVEVPGDEEFMWYGSGMERKEVKWLRKVANRVM